MALSSADIVRIENNIDAVNAWAEGDASHSQAMANGRVVPSPLKVITDARLFKAPTAFSSGTTYTDATQPVTQAGVVYAPIPSLLPIGPSAFNSAEWYVVQGYISGSGATLDMNGGSIQDALTLGINDGAPDCPLLVVGPSSVGGHLTPAASTMMTLKNRGGLDAALSLITDGVNDKFVNFGTNGDENVGRIAYTSSDAFIFRTNTLDRMMIDSAGQVGIGTTNIDDLLHIFAASDATFKIESGDAGRAIIRIQNATTGQSDANGILFGLTAAEEAIFYNFENTDMLFATNDTVRAVIRASGEFGIGTTAPAGLLEVYGIGAPTTMFRIVSDGGGAFRIGAADNSANPVWEMGSNASEDISIQPAGTEVMRLYAAGGATIGSPTGGDQGAGTLNAVGVYDDGALLTCYVMDAALDGNIDISAWNARVPDRIIEPVTAEVINSNDEPEMVEIEPGRTEVRNHTPAAQFADRMTRDLDPKTFFEDASSRRALPAFPTREEWAADGPLSTGDLIQRLWETAETQSVHINKLLERIENLESN